MKGMTEGTIGVNKVVAAGLWVIVAALLIAAWVVVLAADGSEIGVVLAITACPIAGLACVFQLRCAAIRLARLIRTCSDAADRRRDLTSV